MSPALSVLSLRQRGRLVFPAVFGDWRPEEPPADLAGPSLTWSRQAAPRRPSVRILTLDNEPASSDAVLIARARAVIDGADEAWAETALRLDAIRFADDLRLALWFSHASSNTSGAVTLTLALLGSVCEIVMISQGRDTEDQAFDDLRAVAVHGRFAERPSAPPRT